MGITNDQDQAGSSTQAEKKPYVKPGFPSHKVTNPDLTGVPAIDKIIKFGEDLEKRQRPDFDNYALAIELDKMAAYGVSGQAETLLRIAAMRLAKAATDPNAWKPFVHGSPEEYSVVEANSIYAGTVTTFHLQHKEDKAIHIISVDGGDRLIDHRCIPKEMAGEYMRFTNGGYRG